MRVGTLGLHTAALRDFAIFAFLQNISINFSSYYLHIMITYEDDSRLDALNESVIFNTLQKVKKSVYANAKKLKYDIAILRSISNRKIDESRRVDMICNRSTTYKAVLNEKSRIKNNSFVKIVCSWKIVFIKYKNIKKWQLKIVDSNHNHESTKKFFDLADHRRRDIASVYEAIDQIADQISAAILDDLRKKNSDITIQLKNVVNARARLRSRKLDKYTSIQTLLRVLYRNNWFMKFELKINNKRVNNDSRICIKKQVDFQADAKTFLRQ